MFANSQIKRELEKAMKWIGALLIASGLLAVAVFAPSLFKPEIVYLEATKVPFRVKPMNVWTRDVPNSEHEDKCIFTDYECDEQFYLIIENLKDNCCVEELTTES